jgi:SOS-response transcriptional repressor LexA
MHEISGSRLSRLVDLGLTGQQALIYLFVFDTVMRAGSQPSFRMICGEFGFTSPTAVSGHLDALAKKGWLLRSGGGSRAITFLRGPDGEEFRGFTYREGP